MRVKKKTCCICHATFIPDRKVGDRQKTCGCKACQKALKQRNNAIWREKNPSFVKNDYPRVKGWLDQHPGYLEQYRQRHPEYVLKNREDQKHRDRARKLHLDIQAKLDRQPLDILKQIDIISKSAHLDIQDEFILQPLEVTLVLSKLSHRVHLAIQDKMAFPAHLRDNGAIKQGGGAYGCPMGHGP